MSPINSRAKGANAEREFIALHLAEHWPEAKRNIDQFGGDKRDVIGVAGCHFQLKRTERLRIWDAIEQAETEAAQHDIPIVAFRRNRGKWYCAIEASELIALLRMRED